MNDNARRDIYETLHATDWRNLSARHRRAAQRNATGSTAIDGHASSRGYDSAGGSGGMLVDGETIPATGVELAAIARPQTDEVDIVLGQIGKALLQIEAGRRGVLDGLRRFDELQTYERPHGHTATKCSQESCEGVVGSGRKGRCEACYSIGYRWEHDPAHPERLGQPWPIVAESVIAEREVRRRRQRCTPSRA